MFRTEEDVPLRSQRRLLRCHPGKKDKMGEVEAVGEAMEVEVVVEEEEDGEEVDGTKVDMEIMEDMVDMEGREAGTSIKCD